MIKTSLSIDRSHTHGKTLRPTPSIVNIYSIDMTKYQEGFSAESIVMSDPKLCPAPQALPKLCPCLTPSSVILCRHSGPSAMLRIDSNRYPEDGVSENVTFYHSPKLLAYSDCKRGCSH